MPLPTQHSLLCILLIWTTVISIVQAVFFVLFLTRGHTGWSQNNSITAPAQQKHFKENTAPLPPGMLTYKPGPGDIQSSSGTSDISWRSLKSVSGLVSETGTALTIKQGGYYFLNLQVTLQSCGETRVSHTVSMKLDEKVILRGSFDARTNSTGLLSKVEQLSTSEKLLVTIDPPTSCLSFDESVTHLDMIYLPMS